MREKGNVNFTFYVIELFVVFLGVTAGFLLNTWREGYIESKLEEKYLISFYDDIITDKDDLDSLIISSEKKAEKLLNILKETSAGKIPLSKNYAQEILAEILQIEWFSPSNDTYEDIISSGNLNLISDYKIKRKICSYYKFQKELKSVEKYYLDHMNNYVFPIIYKNYDLGGKRFTTKQSYQSLEFSNMYIALLAFINQNNKTYNEIIVKNCELKDDLVKVLNID